MEARRPESSPETAKTEEIMGFNVDRDRGSMLLGYTG